MALLLPLHPLLCPWAASLQSSSSRPLAASRQATSKLSDKHSSSDAIVPACLPTSIPFIPTGQPPKRFQRDGSENVHNLEKMGRGFLSKSFLSGSGKSFMNRLKGRRSNSLDEPTPKIAEDNV